MFDGTLALVGAGNMGGAMLDGWLANGVAPASITVVDPGLPPERRAVWEGQGVSFAEMQEPPDVLLLAVKPQMMADVLQGAVAIAGPDTLVVSVAAGITIATLASAFGAGTPLVRAMPNTPSQVACGVTVCCPTSDVTNAQRDAADALMRAVGTVEWIEDEGLMDAVTGVSGSGPAYAFLLAETLAAAGEKAGLPADLALRLATETVAGAGELLRRSDDDPATLRRNVTSPGGTTAAALEVLTSDDGFPTLLERAVARATARSKELSAP